MARIKEKEDNKQLDKKQRKILKLCQINNRFGLFLGAGSGKTRIVIRHLLSVLNKKKKVNALIVTTKANAIDTWPTQLQEQMKVTGLHFPFHVKHSEYKQIVVPGRNCQYRSRIIICSYQGLKKLLWHYDNEYFDFMIVDESVHVKNWRAVATNIIVTFSQQVKYIYPLSGLPAPNKLEDLYSQVFMIDQGERLGYNVTAFRRNYLQQSAYSKFVWNVKGFPNKTAMKQTQDEVLKKIGDICVTEQTETFVKNLTRPEYHTVNFCLRPKQQKQYKRFEKKSILAIEDKDFTAVSAGVLRMKLLQFVSGNLYEDLDIDDPNPPKVKKYQRTTKERMAAFDKFLKKKYKKGDKLIVSYGFKHSIPDILRVLHRHTDKSKIFVVGPGVSTGQLRQQWDNHKIDIVVSFAGSIAEGLNLQKHGGSIVFYSLMYNYNHFYQLIRRIMRRGNPKKVCNIYVLTCINTADELVAENIDGKARLGKDVMSAARLMEIIKRRVQLYKKSA